MDRDQQREAARAAAAFVAEPMRVDLKAWGGAVWIRRLSVAQAFAAREQAGGNDEDDIPALARNLCSRICDAEGRPTFSASDPGDVELLAAQGLAFLLEVQLAIAEVDTPKKPSTPSESS